MVYTFGRVGSVTHMRVEDYYAQGKRCWFRLHEKPSAFHGGTPHFRVWQDRRRDRRTGAAGTGTPCPLAVSPAWRTIIELGRTVSRMTVEVVWVAASGARLSSLAVGGKPKPNCVESRLPRLGEPHDFACSHKLPKVVHSLHHLVVVHGNMLVLPCRRSR